MYGFSLCLWYLQTVCHCSLSVDVWILITLWYLQTFGDCSLSFDVRFWLSLWYLQVFDPCSMSVDVRIMITSLVSSNFWPLQSVLRCTDYDFSFGIFKPLTIVVSPSTMYGFWLPLWYLQTVGHCSMYVLRCMDSDYAFGIFKLFAIVACPSSM
jgi:hypothetical protein